MGGGRPPPTTFGLIDVWGTTIKARQNGRTSEAGRTNRGPSEAESGASASPWVYLRLTELETDGLKRCRNCGGKMLRSTLQSDLGRHIGHRISPAADVHFWEFVRIKLGWL